MSEAMTAMMEAMGLFWNQATTGAASSQPWNYPATPSPNIAPWNNFNGNMPWLNPSGNNFWGLKSPNINNGLDGVWISNSGERLYIQGSNFYLRPADGRQISGILQIRGRMLMLQNPRLRWSMLYEYAIHDNRLAMRDVHGNLWLYQRLRQ